MKKIIVTTFLLALFVFPGFSQGNEFIVAWQIAEPGTEIKRLVNKTSFQGWNFEYRRAISRRLTVGASVSWNIFHQDIDKSTWEFENVTITSKNWRYTHVVPISANFHFNPFKNTETNWQWFVGGGLGISYINQEVWAGMYSDRAENWRFHVFPELGLRHVMSDQAALFFSTQFMYLPQASVTGNDLAYLNFKIGLSFGQHRSE